MYLLVPVQDFMYIMTDMRKWKLSN